MPGREEVTNVVFNAIDEINELLPKGRQMMKIPEGIIFGEGGLDSLDLINFLVAVEGQVEGQYGMTISLLDEKTMTDMNSQYRTISGLIDYVVSLIKEKE